MKKLKRVFALLLSIISIITVFSGCSGTNTAEQVRDVNSEFRVVAYVPKGTLIDFDNFKKEYINNVTDVILFGVCAFDEEGNVTLDEQFETCYNNIKSLVSSVDGVKLHLNILGPSCQSDSEDWNEQMEDLDQRYSNAFSSDCLVQNIKDVIVKYDFDGVFFDYEYPLQKKYWKDYNKFLIELDESFSDAYKIGIALTSWNLGYQSKAAIEAVDYVEVMSYDLFDENGNHSSVEQAKTDIQKFIDEGYPPYKLDLGLPFYGRPVDKSGYWYEYCSYVNDLDTDGSYYDSTIGQKFYFNTYEMIKEKTSYAYDMGIGGVMVWHWNCDVKYGEDKSLFNAISEVKEVANMQTNEE